MVIAGKDSRGRTKYCCKQVKRACFPNHLHTCNKVRKTLSKNGHILNSYFGVKHFRVKTEYRVCSNMKDKMRNFVPPNRPRNQRVVVTRKHHTRHNPVPLDMSIVRSVQINVRESPNSSCRINLMEDRTFNLDIPTYDWDDLDGISLVDDGSISKRRKYFEHLLTVSKNWRYVIILFVFELLYTRYNFNISFLNF